MNSDSHRNDFSAEFVGHLTAAQFALRAYIAFLVGNSEDAKDILQETNLILWREAATYDASRPFLPWAKKIAWYQVKTFRTRQTRDRLVFDEELLEGIAQAADEAVDTDRMLKALEACYERLSRSQKTVVQSRYFQGRSVQTIAQRLRCSVGSVSMLLFRIRDRLGACVEDVMLKEAPHAQ